MGSRRAAPGQSTRAAKDEYTRSPESVAGIGVAAELERIVRQIEQVSRRIAEIVAEVAMLVASDTAQLMAKAQSASIQGRDLLSEMAEDVRSRIGVRRAQFEKLSEEARAV
jgi:hypothetical protein